MKKTLIILGIMCLFVWAGVVPANIDKAKMDDGTGYCDKHVPVATERHVVVVDSSVNQFTMWTQMMECLSYNPTDEYVQFVCRNFAVGGALDVWQNDKSFSASLTDLRAYDQQQGPARYPHSIASRDGQGPHISAPCLVGGAWGLMMGQYESGGWFSSFWDVPVALSGNIGTHKNNGKQLPNGNILFIGYTGTNEILYQTYNTDLSQQLDNGVVAAATSYIWGFDVNGGIAYVFWYDADLNVYYRTTTDGINWSATQTYNLVIPEPFTNNVLYWEQMAVTAAGNPILVFDIINGDDQEYPYEGKIFVSTASGQPCIEVGITTAGAECFYPTIATGGNYVVVLFGEARSGTGDNTFWDIYYNYSANNGASWSTPRNLTSGVTNRNNCLWQISKRLDPVGTGQFFYAFGCEIANPLRDLYSLIQGNVAVASRWFVGRNPVVGIAENKTEAPNKLALNIAPNPVRNYAGIIYSLPKSGNVSLTLYTADGRLVKTIDHGYKNAGYYTTNVGTSELTNGAYIVVLKTDNKNITGKLVVAH